MTDDWLLLFVKNPLGESTRPLELRHTLPPENGLRLVGKEGDPRAFVVPRPRAAILLCNQGSRVGTWRRASRVLRWEEPVPLSRYPESAPCGQVPTRGITSTVMFPWTYSISTPLWGGHACFCNSCDEQRGQALSWTWSTCVALQKSCSLCNLSISKCLEGFLCVFFFFFSNLLI